NALATGTALAVSRGLFDLAGFAQTVGSVTGSGTVTNSGAAATFTVNNAAADTFAGVLTGALALAKTGAGTLTVNASSNNYTGTTNPNSALEGSVAKPQPTS